MLCGSSLRPGLIPPINTLLTEQPASFSDSGFDIQSSPLPKIGHAPYFHVEPIFFLKLVRRFLPATAIAGFESPVSRSPRMVARRRSAEAAASPVGDGRGAIAPAALRFGERVIARSSRNDSGAVITEKAGQPAVRRPPCAYELGAIRATRTGVLARRVVCGGYRDDSRPCPIP